MSADSLLRPYVSMRGKRYSSFHLCGMAGWALSSLLAVALVRREGLSYLPIAVAWLACVIGFLAFAMATKIVTGEERLTYYRHEVVLVAVAGAVLRLMHRPVFQYLDIVILGVGLFLACGRIGCLMVGCCHGRPSRWGVRYGRKHARYGFASHLAGVRLFPVQAVESVAVSAIVVLGALLFANRPAGAALAWYTMTYGAVRFGLEFLRGDPDRPYWLGYSESQWISLLLTGSILFGELSGRLPLSTWHAGVFAGLALTMVVVSLRRLVDRGIRFQLLQARHVDEIARAIRLDLKPSGPSGVPRVRQTSLGVQISGGSIETSGARLLHYAFSAPAQGMTGKRAATLARLMEQLTPGLGSPSLVEGRQGVFHVLFPPAAAGEAAR